MIMLRTAGDLLSGSLFISSVRFPLAYEFTPLSKEHQSHIVGGIRLGHHGCGCLGQD